VKGVLATSLERGDPSDGVASGMTDEELIFVWRFEQLQRAGFEASSRST
jgi:hypothetical protein